MTLRERMEHIRANWPKIPSDEIETQVEWNAAFYAEILSECGDGLTMTAEQCTALARAGVAPTDEQLLPLALHAELVARLEADWSHSS
jgi:hypothetical protein